MAVRVFTIGHSTRPIDALIDLLRAHDVRQLIDVRTVPRSRRHPQFDREALAASLAGAGIVYAHMPGLGGLRTPRRDSINTAWRRDGFRGYADHMQTPEFRASLDALTTQAQRMPTAIMCAEASPAHCHRSLLSDALLAAGADVRHILGADRADPHAMTAFARVDARRVTYPSSQPDLPLTDV
jgi:uncharacterized protein (DUF488 family)